MARFFGAIGYAEPAVETSPGVYEERIIEKQYYGDIQRVSRKYQAADNINGEITVNHQISVVADAYALQHFFSIRYVNWSGTNWLVNTVEVARPRLTLYIGMEYHGATAD